MKGVEKAELFFGDCDAIAKIKADKIHEIENLVIEKISIIDSVEPSVTLICVDEGIPE